MLSTSSPPFFNKRILEFHFSIQKLPACLIILRKFNGLQVKQHLQWELASRLRMSHKIVWLAHQN